MSANQALPTELLQVLHDLQFIKYFNVAIYAVMIYDYISCLPDEINFMWAAEWRAGKTLYIVNRYLVFVDPTILMVYLLGTDSNPVTCNALLAGTSWIAIAGITISEIILSMRTYAIWGQSRSILGVLVVLNLAMFVSNIVTVHAFLGTVTYGPSPANIVIACAPLSIDSHIWIAYAFLMLFELTIVILTVWKAFSTWVQGRNALTMTLYRDAIMFFVFLFLMSIANEVLQATPKLSTFYDLLTDTQRIMHAILSGKILLHLRMQARRADQLTGSTAVQRSLLKDFRPAEDSRTRYNSIELSTAA